VRNTADGDALRQKGSDRLTPVIIDVTDPGLIASAAEAVKSAVGGSGLAGLVNNAGIAVAGPLEFLPLAELRRQIEVNVIGQVATTQAFLPLLRRGKGRIVNIGSDAGRLSMPFLAAYCASKFALEALTDALRMELRPWGIEVSIVDPGNTATPIWEKSRAAAVELIRNMPEPAHQLYDPAITAVRKAAEREARTAIPPHSVARAVAHALTAPRPKTRYLVGLDARMRVAITRLLPDRLCDRLVLRHMGLK
jgi:NAD(P)-dependent dehydrogenase (short-subunit alcohol dehydrogenase family)